MSQDVHIVSVINGSTQAQLDRLIVALLPGQAVAAGGGAGASVNVVVTGLDLPATYGVHALPDQDATCYVTGKTQSGFTIVVNPRLATETLVAGKVDILVVA